MTLLGESLGDFESTQKAKRMMINVLEVHFRMNVRTLLI
jgi:hypothetical protein